MAVFYFPTEDEIDGESLKGKAVNERSRKRGIDRGRGERGGE